MKSTTAATILLMLASVARVAATDCDAQYNQCKQNHGVEAATACLAQLQTCRLQNIIHGGEQGGNDNSKDSPDDPKGDHDGH